MRSFVLLCLFALISTLSSVTPTEASTLVDTFNIVDTQTWTAADSPYFVNGNLEIGASGVLNIEAGTEVRMQNGRKIDVRGVLNIQGDSATPVKFTNTNDFVFNFSDYWSGITFHPNSKSDIKGLDMKFSNVGLTNEGGEISVLDSVLSHNSGSINQKSGTTTIDNIQINQSTTAIILEGGYLSLTDSTVSDSASYAFISYTNAPGQFFARNNTFVNSAHGPFLDVGIDFDIADTTFVGGDIPMWRVGGTVRTSKSLPADTYALNGIIVEPEGALTISAGTTLKGQSGGYLINRGGTLNISGTPENPIIFTSLTDDGSIKTGGVIAEQGTTNIHNTLLKHSSGTAFIGPFNTAVGSLINMGGTINADGLQIEDGNYTGIHHHQGTTTIINSALQSGSYNNAIVFDFGELNIHDSSFLASPSFYSLWNRENVNTPDVRNNYWGTPEGPIHPTLNASGTAAPIEGLALFTPFLSAPPGNNDTDCCSSVLFLPGFMASDLYVQENIFENKLWPPTSLLKTDIEKLMLDQNGNPVTPGIYTKDILQEAFGFNVYKSFTEKMDGMVTDRDIMEWKRFPYDWRRDIPEIVNSYTTIKTGNGFENKKLIDEAVALAQRSPTGKISIIGHSNGGLVGKYLIKELAEQGQADIVDQFITLATPQIGTPKALASLLHGDKQEIPPFIGILMNKELARQLGHNMRSAYNLVPTNSYFETISEPVISFQDSINQVFNYSASGLPKSISTHHDLLDFINSDNRGTVSGESTNIPATLRTDFSNESETTIDELASWQIPSHIKVYNIAGWGEQTIKTIGYRSKQEMECSNQSGLYTCGPQYSWDRKLLMTEDGDGTVVSPSATSYNATEKYYLNLFDLNSNRSNLKHHNILEASELLETLSKIFTKSLNNLPNFISTQKPAPSNQNLQLSVHSPVSLGIYSANNLYTGPSSTTPTDAFSFIKEEIPNSYYMEIGEDKYIGVPTNENYTVNIQGEGVGTFTFNQEVLDGDQVLDSKSFIDIPVTPSTKAFLNIYNGNLSSNLSLDIDGNGSVDVQVQSGNEFDPVAYLTIMKSIIKSFELKKSQETSLIKKVDNLIKLLQNGKIQKASMKAEAHVKRLNSRFKKLNDYKKNRNKKLTPEEIQIIIQNLEEFISNLK